MSAYEDLTAAVPEGEGLRFHQALRRGGRIVGLTDDRLLVLDDEGRTSVSHDNVVEVTVQDVDWFLVILSVALVGWGVLTLQRNVLVGVVGVGLGGASLYRTYGRRGKVTVRVTNRPKPLVVYPENPDAFREALRPMLDAPAEDGTGVDA